MSLPSLRLKANADRRLRAGHLWVYSNEIDVANTPLHGFKAGDQAVLDSVGPLPLLAVETPVADPANLRLTAGCAAPVSLVACRALSPTHTAAPRRHGLDSSTAPALLPVA